MRSKEIMHLKGEEVMESDESEAEEEAPVKKKSQSKKDKEKEPAEEEPIKKGKGDADSSSDEGMDSEEDDIPTQKASKKAANAKLKKDLEQE